MSITPTMIMSRYLSVRKYEESKMFEIEDNEMSIIDYSFH